MNYTYKTLINEIKEKSRLGLIAWSPSSYGNTYQAPLGKGIIMIMHDLNEKGSYSPDYDPPLASLSFLNERGEIFNSINCYSTIDTYYTDLKEIYEAANNNYMKIDETLQSMIDDLSNRK